MQRFRLRAAAILIGLFLPALGVCASLSVPSALQSCCPTAGPAGSSCCGEESSSSCPAPDRAPAGPRCRACEELLAFSGEEVPGLRAPEAALPVPPTVAEAPCPAALAPRHFRALAASPPLELLDESLRN